MRLLLTGGGTGGHVYPLLSVLDELKMRLKGERIDTLYLGARGGIEEKILKEKDIQSFFVYSGKWRRYWLRWPPALFFNIIDLFKLFAGFLQAFFILLNFRPEVILAKGGYATLPVVFASRFFQIPVIIHESDIVMGISNKFAFRFAKKICVSFSLEFYPHLPKEKLVLTGIPLRKEFFRFPTSNPSAGGQSPSSKLPTILITGGSQGSRILNQAIFGALPDFVKQFSIIHLTGDLDYEKAETLSSKLKQNKDRYFVYRFLDKEMVRKMKEADLIISRSGASTLAEIAALGKASILIPLEGSASDHQNKNALIFNQKEAAVVIQEKELNSKKLLKEVKKLIKDKLGLQKMGENAKMLSHPEAAKKIVDVILEERKA